MLFAQHGFQVTGIDFAPSAIKATNDKFVQAGIAGKTGFLLERDVFEIHEYDSYFDYVLEHSFFNSIDPSRRRTYAWTIHDLLKPGGKLISLWWTVERLQGPPFGVSKEDIYALFANQFVFDLVHIPNDSVPARRGTELFTLMTRR
jgi:SAM-dependent methyltransferase